MPTAPPSAVRHMRVRDPRRCRTINRIRGLPRSTPSMKPPIEKPSEQVMRFFTPELYLKFNSSNDGEADQADEAWEAAIRAYRHHLKGVRDKMPSQVVRLSE